MIRAYRSWFQDLINVWTMPATVLKKIIIASSVYDCTVEDVELMT